MSEIERAPWSLDDAPFLYLFVHRALGRMVDTVMIGGQLVMQNRKILTIDEESLYQQVREEASLGQTEEQKRYSEMMAKVKPYYQTRYNEWVSQLELDPYFVMNSRI